jgi:hypothetical protein
MVQQVRKACKVFKARLVLTVQRVRKERRAFKA